MSAAGKRAGAAGGSATAASRSSSRRWQCGAPAASGSAWCRTCRGHRWSGSSKSPGRQAPPCGRTAGRATPRSSSTGMTTDRQRRGRRRRPRSCSRGSTASSLHLKTWLWGTHRGGSRQHLPHYLDEFVFRFNRHRTPMAAFQSLLGLLGGCACVAPVGLHFPVCAGRTSARSWDRRRSPRVPALPGTGRPTRSRSPTQIRIRARGLGPAPRRTVPASVRTRRSISSLSSVRMQIWLCFLWTSIPIWSMAGPSHSCGLDRVLFVGRLYATTLSEGSAASSHLRSHVAPLEDRGQRSAILEASMATCFAADTAMKVATDAVQILGPSATRASSRWSATCATPRSCGSTREPTRSSG